MLDTAIRWILVPPAAVAGWIAGLVIGLLVGGLFQRICLAEGGDLPPDIGMAVCAAVAAIGTVLGACAAAPRAQLATAVLTFGTGVWAAWNLLGHWYFPEGHPRAYSSSHLPFAGAVLGGVTGVLLAWCGVVRWCQPVHAST